MNTPQGESSNVANRDQFDIVDAQESYGEHPEKQYSKCAKEKPEIVGSYFYYPIDLFGSLGKLVCCIFHKVTVVCGPDFCFIN